MLGTIAAILFGIAFVLSATSTVPSEALFAPVTLVEAGLCLLALHLSGIGTGLSLPRTPGRGSALRGRIVTIRPLRNPESHRRSPRIPRGVAMTSRPGVSGYPRAPGARPSGTASVRPKTNRPAGAPRFRTPGDDMGPWSPAAACRKADPELFFPMGPSGLSREQTRRAKAICQQCPVLESCRSWAMAYPKLAEYGVWGGLSEDERRTLRGRELRAARRPE